MNHEQIPTKGNKLHELLGQVADPETPEERDEAECAIREMVAAAWDEGLDAGLNGGWDNPYAPKDPS